ncbi:MAG: hypothetical protein H6538_05820 [Bacteroidales bacterium]|nr:hypothetical protein [Bacteroidales bacterium]MCB9000081.1 hypothetical protein [Bacteroidales bacterium]MCB9012730.1 hypothetical protein [Bacteroidales bacterium]
MKNQVLSLTVLAMLLSFIPVISSLGQDISGSEKKTKGGWTKEDLKNFEKIDSLIKNQQFVFESEFFQSSDELFIAVDSGYAEIQAGNRNNLQGRITQYQVKRNDKKKTLSVTIKMRGSMSTGDIFLFIAADGTGDARVNSDFPGNFSYTGKVVDLQHTTIYQGRSPFIH